MEQREYKFRGRRKDTGEWVYGWYVNRGGVKHQIVTEDATFPFEVFPETVGQYSGLKDSKGVEIYESDLIKDKDGDIWLIRYYKEEACFVFQNPHNKGNFNTLTWLSDGEMIDLVGGVFKDCEIIGNIYSNPDLLKQ